MSIQLSATPKQRKNLVILVNYLISLRGTILAAEYNHNYEHTCSYGYAIKSARVADLNKKYTLTENTYFIKDPNLDSSDIAEQVFGIDYYNYIVNGPYTTKYDNFKSIRNFDGGQDQMNEVISCLISAYQITPEELQSNVVIDKTTTCKIQERVKKLKAFLNIAAEFKDDRTIKLTDQVKAVKAEIKALELALSL